MLRPFYWRTLGIALIGFMEQEEHQAPDSASRLAAKMRTESHAALIARISEALQVPMEDVEQAYFAAWHELVDGAKVHDYLPLFAARRVTEVFRKKREAQSS
jgi:hypothetical protein